MQNKIRNKHANKSLKAKGNHFNNYKGEQGYYKIDKSLPFSAIFKYLTCFIIIVILSFYLITK